MADSKKYDGSQWEHSLRKMTTATADIEPTIYTDGTVITAYTIKGNTVQSGTPTPSNPVEVNGVGVRTENLLNADIYYGTYKQADGTYQSTRANLYNVQIKPFTADDIGKTFTFVADISPITGNARLCANINGTIVSGSNTEKSVVTFTVETADDSIFFNYGSGSTTVTTLSDIMLVEGETAPTSYIPWGYKIPISSGQQTIDIYIGDLPLLKSLDGTAVDEISNGTLTRRVDSDGSVLPTPTTTQITMPSISTTEGANSISIDTTVQPSEFSATWSGWHDSSVKEYDGSDWQ